MPVEAESDLRARVEQLLDAGEVEPSDLQWLMATTVKLYAQRLERGEDIGPFPAPGDGPDVTPTEVSRASSAMLEALDIEIFELALWRSWGGAA